MVHVSDLAWGNSHLWLWQVLCRPNTRREYERSNNAGWPTSFVLVGVNWNRWYVHKESCQRSKRPDKEVQMSTMRPAVTEQVASGDVLVIAQASRGIVFGGWLNRQYLLSFSLSLAPLGCYYYYSSLAHSRLSWQSVGRLRPISET